MPMKRAIIPAICTCLLGCGSADFSTQSGTSTIQEDETPPVDIDTEVTRKPTVDPGHDTGARTFETKSFRLKQVTEVKPIDIIFAVDTSGSMDDEKSFLEANMQRFVQEVTAEQEIDYRIIVVGDEFTFAVSDPSRMFVQANKIGSTDALQVVSRMIVNGSLAIRANSQKHFIFITDDNARRVLASDFISALDQNPWTKDKSRVHGLVGLATSTPTDVCTIEDEGFEYQLLTEDQRYGGTLQDLCIEDWGALLTQFAKDIVEQSLSDRVSTSLAIDVSRPYVVRLDDERLTEEQYEIDAETGEIRILDTELLSSESTLTIKYYPQVE